jgi:hypothetical protein
VSEGPWWHPGEKDDWDERLPPFVILEPDYSAELPLASEEGMLAWQQTKFSQLLDRLAAWQEVEGPRLKIKDAPKPNTGSGISRLLLTTTQFSGSLARANSRAVSAGS